MIQVRRTSASGPVQAEKVVAWDKWLARQAAHKGSEARLKICEKGVVPHEFPSEPIQLISPVCAFGSLARIDGVYEFQDLIEVFARKDIPEMCCGEVVAGPQRR